MVWQILDNKTWEDLPERSVFWIFFTHAKTTTKYKIQQFINEFKTNPKYKNKMLRLNDISKHTLHIKYIPDVI